MGIEAVTLHYYRYAWAQRADNPPVSPIAILRHQEFVSEAEFLVNRTGDISEHSFPIHRTKVEHGRGPLDLGDARAFCE